MAKIVNDYNILMSEILPIPVLIYSPSIVFTNEIIAFDALGSYDLDGSIMNYLWDFGDGETSTEQNPQHTYADSGTYYVCLTAKDNCTENVFCDSITITSVGVEEYANKDILEFMAYPNPFTNRNRHTHLSNGLFVNDDCF